MRRVSTPADNVVIVGAGCSALVTDLLAAGYRSITAVDISAAALDRLADSLGAQARHVDLVVSDVCDFEPTTQFDVWHDRATFHFLTDPAQQRAYIERVSTAVVGGGHLVLSGFAPDGPEQCSGLDVARHSADQLSELFGADFELLGDDIIDHITPWGSSQRFVHTLFRRV